MKKYLSLLLLSCLVAFTASAQQVRVITGIVTDSLLKSPLANVVVRVKGTDVLTATDKKGQFSLKTATDALILEVNAAGYPAVNVAVKDGQNKITVQLTKLQPLDKKRNQYVMQGNTNDALQGKVAGVSSSALSEVVVVGYGVQKRRSVTASVSTIRGTSKNYAPSPVYNTEDYSPINENIFHTATDQPLSTFSIDVDRASYSNVRRFLNQGMMPEADAVRVEEMINYFDYQYKAPEGKDPVAIYTDMAVCPWNTAHQLVRVALKSKQVDTRELPPSNLVFLIDVSGSMYGENRLPLVKRAFAVLTEQLRAEDKVAIVVYAGAAGVVLPATSGSDKKKILAALDQLEAGGSTAGGAGIQLAYTIAGELYSKNSNTRVILATDGDFNVGVSSDGELTGMIEKERERGISLSVLGFGMGNYKDNKLELLADKGNGNYAYIDNFEEARRTFVTEFGGTLFTVAKDVKLQIEFNPQFVQSYRLVGYENRVLANEDFNNDKKDAGDMGVGHTVTALYEIIPAGTKGTAVNWVDPLKYQEGKVIGNKSEVLTVKLRYKQPDANKSLLMEKVLPYSNQEITAAPEDFRMAAAVAAFGQLLRNSAFKGTATYDQVLSWAGNSKGTDTEGYRAEFIQLVKKAMLLDKE
ncbi:Ca-activated chloride channel family protein [Chitinophaga ginsengisegetis]|uniref:Ca-activated chloride channel family protein n=1 Tax=Chitinophaga ginsengisegetis TaxID=393003 RepID=A0A1T5P4N5_9BACT|nr:VWA domain-containing protein [Chitinophaga ginsengisegetis]SKD07675.1 Ca-activated chloride channel family protein [Chitinophaga ginsengisegetis]